MTAKSETRIKAVNSKLLMVNKGRKGRAIRANRHSGGSRKPGLIVIPSRIGVRDDGQAGNQDKGRKW